MSTRYRRRLPHDPDYVSPRARAVALAVLGLLMATGAVILITAPAWSRLFCGQP